MNNKLDILFQEFTDETPGCIVCVVKNEKVILTSTYGLANLETKSAITSNTAFRLASLTKPFTAMAIMLLKEKKLFSFDDRLTDFFPDFPAYGKEITVRHLLNHTSGMPDHEMPLYKKISKGFEPTIYDVLAILQEQKSAFFKPGSKYLYSDAGYVVLALIIEKVSGYKYSRFLTDNIFQKLGMENTVVLDETKPTVKNKAVGYKKIRDKYQVYDYDPLNYIVGDEGIYSTITDLVKWRKAWCSEILVSKKTLNEALRIPRLANSAGRCCFSWFIKGKKILFQDGIWVGFSNIMLTLTHKETTAIILSNTSQYSDEIKRVDIALKVLKIVSC